MKSPHSLTLGSSTFFDAKCQSIKGNSIDKQSWCMCVKRLPSCLSWLQQGRIKEEDIVINQCSTGGKEVWVRACMYMHAVQVSLLPLSLRCNHEGALTDESRVTATQRNTAFSDIHCPKAQSQQQLHMLFLW